MKNISETMTLRAGTWSVLEMMCPWKNDGENVQRFLLFRDGES